jgi:phosphatidate cytidylyltransferase
MKTFKSFLTRAVSALIAVAVIFALFYFWNVNGLKALVGFAVVMGTWELTRMLFCKEESLFIKVLFALLVVATFCGTISSLGTGLVVYSISTIAIITATLLRYNGEGDLQKMLTLQSKTSLGVFYIGLLPAFAYRILDHNNGVSWFIYLLAVVFTGDTLAYVSGLLFGQHKIMPSVSPKKTWEGSVGGLFGSLLAGLFCWLFLFPENNLGSLLILAGVTGFVGQFGDFFESLVKRIAEVKDSGRIMPGHGGVLDRIDAVLFASPIVLAGILILSHLLP